MQESSLHESLQHGGGVEACEHNSIQLNHSATAHQRSRKLLGPDLHRNAFLNRLQARSFLETACGQAARVRGSQGGKLSVEVLS